MPAACAVHRAAACEDALTLNRRADSSSASPDTLTTTGRKRTFPDSPKWGVGSRHGKRQNGGNSSRSRASCNSCTAMRHDQRKPIVVNSEFMLEKTKFWGALVSANFSCIAILCLLVTGCGITPIQHHQYHVSFSENDQQHEVTESYSCELHFSIAENDPGPHWQTNIRSRYKTALMDGTDAWIVPVGTLSKTNKYCDSNNAEVKSSIYISDLENKAHFFYISDSNNFFKERKIQINKSEVLYSTQKATDAPEDSAQWTGGPTSHELYYYITITKIPAKAIAASLATSIPNVHIDTLKKGPIPYINLPNGFENVFDREYLGTFENERVLISNAKEEWTYPDRDAKQAIDIFISPSGFPIGFPDRNFIKKVRYKDSEIDFLISFNNCRLLFDATNNEYILLHVKRILVGFE